MTWTAWDYVVVALALLQLAALAGAGVAGLSILRGPVRDLAGRGRDLTAKGAAVADTTARAVRANAAHVRAIGADVKGVAAALRAPDPAASLPINYGTVRKALAAVGTTRRGVKALNALRARRRATAAAASFSASAAVPPGPAAAAKARAVRRASLAERLGLVPPAARHVARFLPYARMLWQVRKQLRG